MSEEIKDQISLFCSLIKDRRFGDGALRILESVLASRDVRSLSEIRSALRAFTRSESVSAFQEVSGRSAEQRLIVLDFFVRAFALIGDVENCLALKYEALVLREQKYINDHVLQVSCDEWLTFAEDSLNHGFHSIAIRGYENALLFIQRTHTEDSIRGTLTLEPGTSSSELCEKIKKTRDMAIASVSSNSVQAQTAEYLKMKAIQQNRSCNSCIVGTRYPASSVFRDGIKKRSIKGLREWQGLP